MVSRPMIMLRISIYFGDEWLNSRFIIQVIAMKISHQRLPFLNYLISSYDRTNMKLVFK